MTKLKNAFLAFLPAHEQARQDIDAKYLAARAIYRYKLDWLVANKNHIIVLDNGDYDETLTKVKRSDSSSV